MLIKRTRPVVVALWADTHPNSRTGLIHPDGHTYEEGGSYQPGRPQLWLWRRWLEFWELAAELKKAHRADLWAVQVGDGCDDNKHSHYGLITPNRAGIVSIATATWEPVLKIADLKFVLRGTEAHVGGAGELEELLAEKIGAQKDELRGTNSWWWLPIRAHQTTIDLAHHPGSNSLRPWTRGGGANRQAVILVYDYADSGDPLPRYGVRAHVHHLEDSGENHKVRVLFLPPWQLCTLYSHRIGFTGRLEKVGGIFIVCHPDGESQVIIKQYPAKRREPWTK